MSQEQDQETARRARAQAVGLFRYGLIADALDEALSTKQRSRLVREVADRLEELLARRSRAVKPRRGRRGRGPGAGSS